MFLPGEVIPYYIQMWQKIEIACEKKRPPPSGIISGDPMSPTQVEKPSPSLLSENIKIIKTMAKSPTLHKSSPHWCHRWCTQWLGRHRLNCSRSPVQPPESKTAQPRSLLYLFCHRTASDLATQHSAGKIFHTRLVIMITWGRSGMPLLLELRPQPTWIVWMVEVDFGFSICVEFKLFPPWERLAFEEQLPLLEDKPAPPCCQSGPVVARRREPGRRRWWLGQSRGGGGARPLALCHRPQPPDCVPPPEQSFDGIQKTKSPGWKAMLGWAAASMRQRSGRCRWWWGSRSRGELRLRRWQDRSRPARDAAWLRHRLFLRRCSSEADTRWSMRLEASSAWAGWRCSTVWSGFPREEVLWLFCRQKVGRGRLVAWRAGTIESQIFVSHRPSDRTLQFMLKPSQLGCDNQTK